MKKSKINVKEERKEQLNIIIKEKIEYYHKRKNWQIVKLASQSGLPQVSFR